MIILQDTLIGFKYSDSVFGVVPKTQGLAVILEMDIGQGYGFATEAGKREHVLFRAHGFFKDKHDFNNNDVKVAQNIAAAYDKVAAAYSKTAWYYSPWCEHRADSKLAQKVHDACKEAAPHCVIVNCPLPDGAILPNSLNEVHSYHPRSPINAFSWDGVTPNGRASVQQMKKSFPKAEYFGVWRSQYNGKAKDTESTPRKNRKNWATKGQVQEAISWS